MNRIAPNVAKVVLFFCAGLFAVAVTAPVGPGELHAQQDFNFNQPPSPPLILPLHPGFS